MPETTLISVRVPLSTARRLEALAAATGQSKSLLGAEAIEEYVSLQEWQIKAVEKGIQSANKGRFVEHPDVEDWLSSWGTDEEKDMPA
ncbi:MAG: ribbon-helix-helix protein, CopG family [Blastocatellia bacterium]|nr:ribbon-helix-helix protein, CopG family [Blastocatellia bacterium]